MLRLSLTRARTAAPSGAPRTTRNVCMADVTQGPLAELAGQMRRSRPAYRRTLPSPQTGVVCLREQNLFLCNGMGSAHPADLVNGYYYPLDRSQIKQLRRAAGKQELGRRSRMNPDYYESAAYMRECFFFALHRGRSHRMAAQRCESVSFHKSQAVEGFADAATCRISYLKRRHNGPRS